MKVYIAVHGEKYEGNETLSVHRSRGKATEAALKVPCHFPGGWEETGDKDTWENGCDFVCVEEHEVRP